MLLSTNKPTFNKLLSRDGHEFNCVMVCDPIYINVGACLSKIIIVALE